jgi:hypothetical protein
VHVNIPPIKKIFKLLPNQRKLITFLHLDVNKKVGRDRNTKSKKLAIHGADVPATEKEVDIEKIRKVIDCQVVCLW